MSLFQWKINNNSLISLGIQAVFKSLCLIIFKNYNWLKSAQKSGLYIEICWDVSQNSMCAFPSPSLLFFSFNIFVEKTRPSVHMFSHSLRPRDIIW